MFSGFQSEWLRGWFCGKDTGANFSKTVLQSFPWESSQVIFYFFFYILQLQISVNIKLLIRVSFGIWFSLYSIWLNIISLWQSLFAIKALFIDNWAWEWNLGIWRKYSWFFFQGKNHSGPLPGTSEVWGKWQSLISIKDPRLFHDSWGQITKWKAASSTPLSIKAHGIQIINDRPLKPLTRRKCIDNLSSQKSGRNSPQTTLWKKNT